MHLGPPLPLDSSLLGILITLTPFSSKVLFVISFLSYAITTPGERQMQLDPSDHCSRSMATLSFPPHGINTTCSFIYLSNISSNFSFVLIVLILLGVVLLAVYAIVGLTDNIVLVLAAVLFVAGILSYIFLNKLFIGNGK